MTLKELQKLIKEEFDALTQEAEGDDLDVNVDSDEVEGDDKSMDTLRKIYDMLKPMFDEEGEMGDDMDKDMDEDMNEDMDEDMMEAKEDDDKKMEEVKDDKEKMEEADLEERAGQGFGDPGNKKTSGTNVGYKTVGTLSEGAKRFQKLANIIK